MKVAFIYNDIFRNSNFGDYHPITLNRVSNVYDLSKIINFQNVEYFFSKIATEEELLLFHKKSYIDILKNTELLQTITDENKKKYNLGTASNPIFREMYRRHATATGSLILAANLIIKKKYNYIFSPGSGAHHGQEDKASGFCYLNDIVTCILYLRKKGFNKILYFDMDAHYGDGVIEFFSKNKDIFTFSIHQENLWPRTGKFLFKEGIINYPVKEGFNDRNFKDVVNNKLIKEFKAFNPEIVLMQMGADCLEDDYMSKLSLSNNSMAFIIEKFKNISKNIIVMGGGGYNPWTTLRAWVYNLAVLADEKEKLKLTNEGVNFMINIYNKKKPKHKWIENIIDFPNIFED